MKLVCWHPFITDHQAYTYIALNDRIAHLQVNSWRIDDRVRSFHGWKRRSGAAGQEYLVPAKKWLHWSYKTLCATADCTHVFGSPFEDWRQFVVMLMACAMGHRVAIISEPYSISAAGYFGESVRWQDWLKQQLRPLLYRGYGALIATRIDTVFAISPLACRQFAAMGVDVRRIVPFGYFVPGPSSATAPTAPSNTLRLVFVGSLIARKGVKTISDAITQLRDANLDVTLDLYGPGNGEHGELTPGVSYRGRLPFGEAAATLSHYDALILPSLFDGWGVVVNEAIQAGLPAIVSDAAGAAAIVAAHGCGIVFRVGDSEDLATQLRHWLRNPDQLRRARNSAEAVAPLLEPVVAADYIVAVLKSRDAEASPPNSPWYPNPLDSKAVR